MIYKYDYLVIGSGIAGMSFALKVAKTGKVALVCKSTLDEANTALAQGGVAAVTNTLVDNFDKHIEDTMIAGDWLSDTEAVKKVVTEAPTQIKELIGWGVDFDKNKDGEFDLHREGGHSEFRILHHQDNTGYEIQQSLIKAVKKFDFSKEVQFSTYAVPMIIGEIRRYLRDNNAVRVSRSLRDIAYKALRARDELTYRWGKEPKISEIAKELGVSDEKVAELYEKGIIAKRELPERPDFYKKTRDWQAIEKEKLGK